MSVGRGEQGPRGIRSGKQIYIGLTPRYIALFTAVFLVMLVGVMIWFYTAGIRQIMNRALNAFDVSAAVSSITLDATTVSVLRGNFSRALEIEALQNSTGYAVGVSLIFFVVTVSFLGAIVAYAQRSITTLTEAARQIAGGKYDVDLSRLYNGRFQSEVSELARAIEASGRAHLREQKLQVEVAELKIQIDHLKRETEVSAIVETDSFKDLKRKAAELRRQSAEEDASE